MAQAARSTFAKREKERARSEKRQMKLARRQKVKGGDAVRAEGTATAVQPDETPK